MTDIIYEGPHGHQGWHCTVYSMHSYIHHTVHIRDVSLMLGKQDDVPTIIVAYNRYLNCIDQLDQGLATAPTKHKEIQLQMTMFTFFLDLCVSQAYVLCKKIQPKEKVMMTEFKRQLCEKVVTNYTTTISSKTTKKHKASNETAEERPDRCPMPSQLETCHSSSHTKHWWTFHKLPSLLY